MFNKRKDTDKITDAITDVFRRFGRGDVVPHAELEEASGLVRGESRYYAMVLRVRKLYRDEAGIWSREINGVGYQLLTEEQTLTEEQARRTKRARRQIHHAEVSAATLPDASLTEHQRRRKHFVLENRARERKALIEADRHEKWLLKPSADKPIRVEPPRVVRPTGTE